MPSPPPPPPPPPPEPPPPPLSDSDRAELSRRADQFYADLAKGVVGDWGRYLAGLPDKLRQPVLVELVILDLGHRWARGEQPLVEEYVARFPELGPTDRIPPKLIVEEHLCRMKAGRPVDLDGYRERFPAQFEVVEPELRVSAHETQVSAAVPPSSGPASAGGASRREGLLSVSQQYEFVRELGRGMFGEVWLARKKPSGIEKAVKILLQPADRDAAKRELRSLELIKNLRHPYLLATEDFWVADNRLHIVMELADGTLRTRFKECRREMLPGIPEDELLGYFQEAAEGLDYLHRNGIVHRDVKPDNVLLLHGHAKVADFGLARHQDAIMASMSFAGTPAYMAPEIWGGAGGPASDEYSLAFAYAELRQGKVPIPPKQTMQEMMIAHLDGLFEFDPMLGEAEQAVLRKAMARVADERYPSCSAFVEALAAALGRSFIKKSGKIPAAPPRPLPPPLTTPSGIESTEDPVLVETLPPASAPPGLKSITGGGPAAGPKSGPNPAHAFGTKAGSGTVSDRRPPLPGPPLRRKPTPPPKSRLLLAGALLLGLLAAVGFVVWLIVGDGGDKGGGQSGGSAGGQANAGQTGHEGGGGPGKGPNGTGNPGMVPPGPFKPTGARQAADAKTRPLSGGEAYDWVVFSPGGVEARFRLIAPTNGPPVRPFYIMETKVSNRLYRSAATSAGLPMRPRQELGGDDAPATNLTAMEAAEFARQAFPGGRLPTPDEWDHAAGLYDHPKDQSGPTVPGGQARVNRLGPSSPLGPEPPDRNQYGLIDMAGNGTEWTRAVVVAPGDPPRVEVKDPVGGDLAVLRGRRYTLKDPLTYARLGYEQKVPQTQLADRPTEWTGFRVVVPGP